MDYPNPYVDPSMYTNNTHEDNFQFNQMPNQMQFNQNQFNQMMNPQMLNPQMMQQMMMQQMMMMQQLLAQMNSNMNMEEFDEEEM
ncbi:MAG: hypothetical protein R3Y64_04230 [Peptostreptococcaceae bacterium]